MNVEETAERKEQLERKAIVLKTGITGKESIAKMVSMVSKVIEIFGKMDLLVNNAGMVDRAPLVKLTVEE